ncbi:MAG TPA: radical SAM protein [Firmicutes bacterium]|nr:radical SAM protein [Bacillota bacterium]
MKVLLIQPRQGAGVGFKSMSVIEPLGLEMVAGALEPEHEVRILDLFDKGNLIPVVKEFSPDACGISCSFTIDVYQTISIARAVKDTRKGVNIFVGGHHASLNPSDFLDPSIDFVVVGEGEATTAEALRCLEQGGDIAGVRGLVINKDGCQVFTGDRDGILDMDKLPKPARDLTHSYRNAYFLGFQKPTAALETARGCPYRCNFCSVWRFYKGRCRTKSAARVVEELSEVGEEYVLITDDNFLMNVERAEEVAMGLRNARIKKKITFQARSDTIVKHPDLIPLWKEAGLFKVFIGFEKASEDELQSVEKRNSVANNEKALDILNKHNIGVVASFIVDPQYDRNDFARLRQYIRDKRIYTPSFSVLTPLPGTELYARMKEKLTTANLELYDFMHAVLPTRLKLDDFYRELARLYISAYRRPEYILKSMGHLIKNLATGRISWKHLLRLLECGWSFITPSSYLNIQASRPS